MGHRRGLEPLIFYFRLQAWTVQEIMPKVMVSGCFRPFLATTPQMKENPTLLTERPRGAGGGSCSTWVAFNN